MNTFLLFAIAFLVVGVNTHRKAVDHAKLFQYPPVLGDVYYWLGASIVMGLLAVVMEAV